MSVEYMPDIPVYMALAEAIHDESEMCEDPSFAECGAREADIAEAIRILVRLDPDWRLVRHSAGTLEIGL